MLLPKRFEGQTVWVVATGPSADPSVAGGAKNVVAVNDACFWGRPDVIYATDLLWWEKRPAALEIKALRLTDGHRPKSLPAGVTALARYPASKRSWGDCDGIVGMKHSGNHAIQAAAIMGAARIILHGFDCRDVGGRSHQWGNGYEFRSRNATPGSYGRWIEGFKAIAPELEARGVEVLNATPGSAIPCWLIVTPEEALCLS